LWGFFPRGNAAWVWNWPPTFIWRLSKRRVNFAFTLLLEYYSSCSFRNV
jgi:hypothetical protein